MSNSDIHCGITNPNTGEFQEGYMKNGVLKYRNPLPWWKKIFGMKKYVNLWSQPVYIGTREIVINGESSRPKALYRETKSSTGENRYFLKAFGRRVYIDTEDFENANLVNAYFYL